MMAKMADSEAVIWRQAEHIGRLRRDYLDLQRMLAVLALRQDGVLVIDCADLAKVPYGTLIQSEHQADGCTVIRVETGEPGQPGSAG